MTVNSSTGDSFVESLLRMRAKTQWLSQNCRKKGTSYLSRYRSLNCKCADIVSRTTQIPSKNSQILQVLSLGVV